MYKVAIIGAGVVGGMIARKMSEYDIKTVILEKENDVATGQSKANSGIVHAGYDPMPGTLKARLNVLGSKMMEETCKELGVKYRRNGALVVGYTDEDLANIEELYKRGLKNGVSELKILDGDEVRKLENNLSKNIKGALYAPSSGVVCPYELTIESIGNAMDNGACLLRNFEVESIDDMSGPAEVVGIEGAAGQGDETAMGSNHAGYKIKAKDGRVVEAEYVINCAGLYSDKIARMIGDDSFTITPRAGEYMLLDKEAGDLVEATIFRVPDERGKGVLATKTVDGNILLGPTAVERESKKDESVTAKSLEYIKEREAEFFEEVPFDKVITQFAGLRAHGDQGDFIINSPRAGFINVAGIESPGLSSAPAIALEVESLLKEIGFAADKKQDFNPFRKKEKHPNSPIICRCEEVTKAEIIDAIRRNPGAVDVDGVKRRTRSGMGRCQGGFCLPSIVEILAEELGIEPEEVTKRGEGSRILYGRVKGGKR